MELSESTPIAKAAANNGNGNHNSSGNNSGGSHTSNATDRVKNSKGYERLDDDVGPEPENIEQRDKDIKQDIVPNKISNVECLMHVLKGMIGTGILALPIAYKNGGLWESFAIVLILGIICTHCMHLLVLAEEELCRKSGTSHLGYPSIMEKAMEFRGGRMQKYSTAGRDLVNAFVLCAQFGVCCVYTVFVATNVQQVINHLHPHSLNDVSYVLIVSAVLVPYVMVKSLKTLAPFSAFANVLHIAGLVIVFSDLFQDLPNINSRPAVGSLSKLPLFFGQAIFAFEGIALVLPLYDKMKQREAFLANLGVLNGGLTTTVCLYTAMGFFGYLKYGDDIKASVTLNLDNDNWLFLSAKLMFAISMFISYGLQYYVIIIMIWPFIERQMTSRGHEIPVYGQYLFRFIIVCLTCAFSSLVPHLDLLISLVGSFSNAFISMIGPAIIDMLVFPASPYLWTKDIFIIVIGVVGFCTGTYTALVEIIKTF